MTLASSSELVAAEEGRVSEQVLHLFRIHTNSAAGDGKSEDADLVADFVLRFH